MNLFAMKISYPIDAETEQELQALLKMCQLKDAVEYGELMHEKYWQQASAGSFIVVIYDEDQDKLVGALSAYDLLAINTYEWSLLVAPDYRQIGIEEGLIEGLKHGLMERNANGEMAVTLHNADMTKILTDNGYVYSSSEIEMRALPEAASISSIVVRPYIASDLNALAVMMEDGFGDVREETVEMADLIAAEQNSQIWIIEQADEVVGTMTTASEGQVLWITAFTVAAAYRQQGIALTLLKWVKNYATEKQFSTLLVEVETENPAALSLYQKAGFINKKQFDFFVVK
ncbi:GNAT family N-acetyltransferase [Kurthia sibirica]|uniref:N-acetyltransferase n=1 Tax=Kurthia sibirica TaxID=202750 RepID=A0A2U3APU5_9BACL|nr:GNAT family N-acetyltransferase [Kurthia sibirica]PWI26562.1 N-acetyltransferase [Kurthia sibirica]GEK32812.1 hypothetical protein KSI01_03450 [Kurthia sibirica]